MLVLTLTVKTESIEEKRSSRIVSHVGRNVNDIHYDDMPAIRAVHFTTFQTEVKTLTTSFDLLKGLK